MTQFTFLQIDSEQLIESISERVAIKLAHITLQCRPSRSLVEGLLNIQEASQFLKLSVSTIYGKVSRNEIPYMKKGKRLYFSTDELMEYLREGRKKTISEIEEEAKSYFMGTKRG